MMILSPKRVLFMGASYQVPEHLVKVRIVKILGNPTVVRFGLGKLIIMEYTDSWAGRAFPRSLYTRAPVRVARANPQGLALDI